MTPLTIDVDPERRVAALLDAPPDAHAALVLAHGAGAGMTHPFMAAVATLLADRGVATLRFNFPYMEAKSRRIDPPAVAQAAVRAAVATAARALDGLPLFAGGKSFGGRMTSQAHAVAALPVHGLVFFGFPLHPAGKAGDERAAHLASATGPLLFLQGTRDALADVALVEGVVARLGARARLRWFEDADHSFHVPARSGRDDAQVRAALADAAVQWMHGVTA